MTTTTQIDTAGNYPFTVDPRGRPSDELIGEVLYRPGSESFLLQHIEDVLNVVAEVRKRRNDRMPGINAGNVECFMELSGYLHLHMGIGSDHCDLPAGEFCILIERPHISDCIEVQRNIPTADDGDPEPGHGRYRHGQRSVLVHVVEFAKNPERVRVSGIAAMVRLQRLYVCEHFTAARSDIAANVNLAGAASWPDFRVEYGKGRTPSTESRGSSLKDEQLVSHVVQGGSQVVDEIPGDGRPIVAVDKERWMWPCDHLTPTLVVLTDEAIRVRGDNLADVILNRLEVFISPAEFRVDTAKGYDQSHVPITLEDDDRQTERRPDPGDASGPHDPGANS